MKYTSSIIFRYGDTDKVKQDSKILHEILQRQGTNLFIDVIAEHVGQVTLKYKISDDEAINFAMELSKDLRGAILERV